MEITLEFCVRSISPQPLVRFSLNITQMFFSVSWCAEPMTQLHKLKVTVQGHGIWGPQGFWGSGDKGSTGIILEELGSKLIILGI